MEGSGLKEPPNLDGHVLSRSVRVLGQVAAMRGIYEELKIDKYLDSYIENIIKVSFIYTCRI